LIQKTNILNNQRSKLSLAVKHKVTHLFIYTLCSCAFKLSYFIFK